MQTDPAHGIPDSLGKCDSLSGIAAGLSSVIAPMMEDNRRAQRPAPEV